LASITARCDEMTLKDQQIEDSFKRLVSFDVFNEELGYLKHMIMDVGKGKKPG
jgi:hypothetical protein